MSFLRLHYYFITGSGNLLLVSGKDGSIISLMPTPEGREIYTAPQVFNSSNETMVLFGTGTTNTGGSLFVFPLKDFGNKNMVSKKLKC